MAASRVSEASVYQPGHVNYLHFDPVHTTDADKRKGLQPARWGGRCSVNNAIGFSRLDITAIIYELETNIIAYVIVLS